MALSKPGVEGSATVELDSAKEVHFWTDLDVEFKRGTALTYTVTLHQSGKEVGKANCDALDVNTKMMSSEKSVGSSRSVSYQGKMKCSTKVPSSGATEIKATFNAKPAPKKLTKFNLVIKQ